MKVDVIVMENTCFLRDKTKKSFAFDLKGSRIGRKANVSYFNKKVEERKFPELMKDINFLEVDDCNWENKLVRIEKAPRDQLLNTLKRDS